MFTHSDQPSSSQDELLREIDAHLTQLEQVVIQEYRRLLAGARSSHHAPTADADPPALAARIHDHPTDGHLRFPAQLATRFQQILAGLQRTLEGSGDRTNLRIVSDFQEELRIRMLMLDHLLERDIPFAYLERACNLAKHKLFFAHRGGGAERQAQPLEASERGRPERGGSPERGFTAIFRREHQAHPPKRGPSHQAGHSHHNGGGRGWLHGLPDYLRFLFLLHHFMEKDEQRLLRPTRRAPALGREFELHLGRAVFEGGDLGEHHWRTRGERPSTSRPDAGQLARSMQEKLMRHNYTVGVRSQFRTHGAEEGRNGVAGVGHLVRPAATARTPEELKRKLRHHASPTGVRAAFGERPEEVKATDSAPWQGIDFEP